MQDRRKSPRFPIANVANITANGPQGNSEVLVRDLSTTGMGCSGDIFYNKGDRVQVTIKLPTSTNDVIEESLTGKIAWVAKFEEEKEREYAYGIEFNDMESRNPKLYAYIRERGEFLFSV